MYVFLKCSSVATSSTSINLPSLLFCSAVVLLPIIENQRDIIIIMNMRTFFGSVPILWWPSGHRNTLERNRKNMNKKKYWNNISAFTPIEWLLHVNYIVYKRILSPFVIFYSLFKFFCYLSSIKVSLGIFKKLKSQREGTTILFIL